MIQRQPVSDAGDVLGGGAGGGGGGGEGDGGVDDGDGENNSDDGDDHAGKRNESLWPKANGLRRFRGKWLRMVMVRHDYAQLR
jgi:hypothetical protein